MFYIKKFKKMIVVALMACTLAICGGFYFSPVSTYAEETVENSEGNGEISNDIQTDEEISVSEETVENSENTEEETFTKEEVIALVKNAYNKSKEWVKNTYAWIIGIGGGGIITLLLSAFWKLIGAKINRSNNLTEDKVNEISEKSSENTVKKIVGKSLNVDIQSEVSESVKEEFSPMIRNSELSMQSAKNAEIGTAMVLKAVAKSRLITEEETAEMESMADSLLSHAQKYGGLSAPIQIKTEMKNEEKTVEDSVSMNLVETPNKPKDKKENESYISF